MDIKRIIREYIESGKELILFHRTTDPSIYEIEPDPTERMGSNHKSFYGTYLSYFIDYASVGNYIYIVRIKPDVNVKVKVFSDPRNEKFANITKEQYDSYVKDGFDALSLNVEKYYGKQVNNLEFVILNKVIVESIDGPYTDDELRKMDVYNERWIHREDDYYDNEYEDYY